MKYNERFWVFVSAIMVSVLCLSFCVSSAQGSKSQENLSGVRPFPHLPGQTSTLLPDGDMLLIGGEGKNGPVTTAGIEDTHTGKITPLSQSMLRARAWHTATVLPNGTVLIFGGLGDGGHIVENAEQFDPTTKQFTYLPALGVTPRAHHTATLLTNGTVLFAGGVGAEGETLASVQLWDPRTNTTTNGPHWLITPLSDHSAILQPDGTVVIWGGRDATGSPVKYGEVYDPETQSFQFLPSQRPERPGPAQVMATIPIDTSRDVPSNVLIAIRFSLPIEAQSVNSKTITLAGPNGNVDSTVIPSEGGMLAFITPKSDLAPATSYTVTLNEVSGIDGTSISEYSFAFTVAENGTGLPALVNWSGGPQNSPYLKLPPLEAKPGTTAISGQVLLQNGLPLKLVTLRVGSDSTKTDGTGRFLLTDIPSGHNVLVMDGHTADTKNAAYGVFQVGTDVTVGKTNKLNYTIWMPVIDTAHTVTIPVPTAQETVIKSPLIPGLELHLPAGTTITDIDGKVVNQVSITPIPVSQPPFPLPAGARVPTYFTIQPGGGWIWVNKSNGPKGGWLVYPNAEHDAPRTNFNFWNYDPKNKGWYVYGHGSVTADGQSVIPDPGVVIYALTGAMVASPSLAPGTGPCNCSEEGGDPIDLGTGLFVYRTVDLSEPGVIPIVLSRTYRQGDGATRDFGIGTQNPYDMYIVGDYFPYTYAQLVLPDGSRIFFQRVTPGSNYAGASYVANTDPGPFFGATMQYTGQAWELTTRDGTSYYFPLWTNPPRYQWDGLGSIYDRNGNVLRITRDSNFNISEIDNPDGRWIQFTYDSSNRVIQAKDEIGRTVSYSYDSSGRLTQVTDANNGVWKYAYDSNNNMTSITNPRNITYLQNQYDSSGRVYHQTHIDGGVYQFAYTTDGNGNITETDETDPDGNVKKVTFNPPPSFVNGFITGGTPATVTYAAGTPQQQAFTYQYQGNTNLLTSVTDPLGRETQYTYDSNGNTTSITRLAGSPNAVTTSFTYGSGYNQVNVVISDLLTSVTDPLGHVTTFSHDSKGNVTAIIDPLGKATRFGYDSEGRVHTETDPATDVTTFNYTGPDLTSISDPLNRVTNFTYDSAGRMLSMTTPMGHMTKYAYNPFDQITSITDALGGVTSFTYDDDRNLSSVTDAEHGQNPTNYSYDNMDRLQTRTDPLGIPESYVYDGNGNLTQFTDRRGKVTTYGYDALNRLTFVGFGTQAGPTYESTINYSYDGGDRLTQAVDSVAGTYARSYDGLDRLTQEQSPEGTVGYTYDADGRRTQMTVSNQSSPVNYSYDNASRLTAITQGSSNVLFSYDAANRRSSLTLPNGITVNYSYDSSSQLSGISYQLAGASLGSLGYSYDGDGRRTQVAGNWARTGIPNATTGAAVYNAANELTTWNGSTLTYDANGNLLTDGTDTYTWNARDQLASIAGPTSASFVYDPFERRLERTINGVATDYLYDGENAVQELSGGVPTANRLTGGTDEFFNRTSGGGSVYPLEDALGSTIALTDSSGSLQTQYTYDPFGNTTESGPPDTNPYQYTGREYDGTDLYYYRARYYDPQAGRFISEDPIRLDSGEVNFYAYAMDSPVDSIDPTGLASCTYFINNGPDGNGWLVCVPDNPRDGGPLMIRAASGNNGGGSHCKNNPACGQEHNRGPIPQGWWHWANANPFYKGSHGGRLLLPNPGNHTTRTGIYSHWCANPFGPSVQPPFCSKGCITASPANTRELDKLLDAEPNSQLYVEP